MPRQAWGWFDLKLNVLNPIYLVVLAIAIVIGVGIYFVWFRSGLEGKLRGGRSPRQTRLESIGIAAMATFAIAAIAQSISFGVFALAALVALLLVGLGRPGLRALAVAAAVLIVVGLAQAVHPYTPS